MRHSEILKPLPYWHIPSSDGASSLLLDGREEAFFSIPRFFFSPGRAIIMEPFFVWKG